MDFPKWKKRRIGNGRSQYMLQVALGNDIASNKVEPVQKSLETDNVEVPCMQRMSGDMDLCRKDYTSGQDFIVLQNVQVHNTPEEITNVEVEPVQKSLETDNVEVPCMQRMSGDMDLCRKDYTSGQDFIVLQNVQVHNTPEEITNVESAPAQTSFGAENDVEQFTQRTSDDFWVNNLVDQDLIELAPQHNSVSHGDLESIMRGKHAPVNLINQDQSEQDTTLDSDSDSLNSIPNSIIEHVHIPESDLSDSNEELSRTRKRNRNPDNWAKATAKRKRNMGQEYTNVKKRVVPAKSVQPPCTEKCRLKCSNRFTENERQSIHDSFWKIGDVDLQRNYFLQCMKPISPKKQKKQNQPAQPPKSYAYYFEFNGNKVKVCKTFYLNTLNISNKRIFTAIHKKDNHGVLKQDMRGRHGKGGHVVELSMKDDIRNHIKSFPTMPSHYCRAESNKQYIDGSLNIATMYRLYKTKCEETGKSFAKLSMYEKIFNSEFNIAFFNPKKDQCLQCEAFKVSTVQEKALKQEQYDKHLKSKELCRAEKQRDIMDENAMVACFDLQAVLSLPCGEISAFFYKRRLASYNFTIFKIREKQGYCFTWHEGLGKRGANEIGSCLFEFLNNHTTENKIIFYSDNCAGQNKNKFVIALLLHCVTTIEKIYEISLKFLVVGHTQNEGDSMHALIEKEKKRCLKSGPLYLPSQMIPIMQLAKKSGNPYRCIEMNHDRFYDLKKLQADMGKNFNINTNGEKVSWGDLCMIKVTKDSPNTIWYKNSYDETDFKKIDIRHRMRSRQNANIELKKAYNGPIKIPQQKKKDLMDLCLTNAIPPVYQDFFRELPSTDAPHSDDSD